MPSISRRGSRTASTLGSRDRRGVRCPRWGGSWHSPHNLHDPPRFHFFDEIQELRYVDRVLGLCAATDLGHGGGLLGSEPKEAEEATFCLRQFHHLCSRPKSSGPDE